MNEKKVVRRNLATALGIVCIILAVSISGIAVVLKNNIAQYNDYVSSHSHSDYDFNVVNSSLYNAMAGLNRLTGILNLENSTTVYSNTEIQLPANFSTQPNIGEYGLDSSPHFGEYAGIAYVNVTSSSRNDTYVNVTYANAKIFDPEFRYTSETDVGTSGTVAFPVLPADFINIRIGVRDTSINAYANVTITYRY
jgi:hypothetical protein